MFAVSVKRSSIGLLEAGLFKGDCAELPSITTKSKYWNTFVFFLVIGELTRGLSSPLTSIRIKLLKEDTSTDELERVVILLVIDALSKASLGLKEILDKFTSSVVYFKLK